MSGVTVIRIVLTPGFNIGNVCVELKPARTPSTLIERSSELISTVSNAAAWIWNVWISSPHSICMDVIGSESVTLKQGGRVPVALIDD